MQAIKSVKGDVRVIFGANEQFFSDREVVMKGESTKGRAECGNKERREVSRLQTERVVRNNDGSASFPSGW